MKSRANRMRGNVKMKSRAKRILAGGAVALTLIFSVGLAAPTSAQAQNRDRNRWDRNDRNDRNNRWDRNDRRDGDRNWDRGDWARRQQIERARAIERARRLAWEREQARRRSYNYPRSSPWNGGGWGNSGYGGGYNNAEVQKGYRDGLDRGQEDAEDRRNPTPNNSSHYRSGNAAYREGFRRGYEVGYRQYAGYRR